MGQDLNGKLFGLLWQIFLLVGPCFDRLRLFCDRVRGICTDMGTERLIANSRDVLPKFCRLIGIVVPIHAQLREKLFPRSLAIGGWRHIWDTVLKRGCTSLDWFPEWLENFKALIC